MTDPVAAADAVVAAVDPGLSSPGVESRDVVLVTGPWLAGATSLIDALRERMPDQTFVEADDLRPADAPAAVVFVVSAIASLTESDCALVDLAANYTDLVIGVVSKIDAHRNWREALAANRARLAARAPRYRHVQWVGAAAAPDLGEPRLDELVGLLRQRLADPDVARRNRLRAWEVRLSTAIDRYQIAAAGSDRQAQVCTLRKNRDDILRGRRLSKSERTIALRSQIQQARVQLTYFARNRCTSVRAELQEDASNWGHLPLAGESRRRVGEFESYVRTRAGEVVDEVDEGITTHLGDVATELGLSAPPPPPELRAPEVSQPPLKSRRLETQLVMILGAGFGFGVALAVTRLFAGLAPGLTIAGLIAGGLVGLLLTVWVVGIRALLRDRAVLDRWVADVTAALRSVVEERVATRVLAAETALTTDLAAHDEVESATAADRVTDIDAELREHAVATAKAAAVRDRRLPPLQQALDAVCAELYGSGSVEATNGSDAALPSDSRAD
jgi:ribose 1,5-bisphosphokinase PhnN